MKFLGRLGEVLAAEVPEHIGITVSVKLHHELRCREFPVMWQMKLRLDTEPREFIVTEQTPGGFERISDAMLETVIREQLAFLPKELPCSAD